MQYNPIRQPLPHPSNLQMKHDDASAPTPDTLLQTPEVNEERQQQILELLAPLLSELTAELTPEKCATIQDPAACTLLLNLLSHLPL